MKIFVITSKSCRESSDFRSIIRDLYFKEFGNWICADDKNRLTWVSQEEGKITDEEYINTCLYQISKADKIIYLTPSSEYPCAFETNASALIQLLYSRLLHKPMRTELI